MTLASVGVAHRQITKKSHFALLFCSLSIRFLVPAHSHTKTQASAREEAKGPQMRFFLFSSSTGLKSASFTRLGASVRSESVIRLCKLQVAKKMHAKIIYSTRTQ
jgi:hypothetical protein